MNKGVNLHRDCTEYCKSTIHGDIITSAITKRSITDLELCSYLNYICTNCESVRDTLGRTALHLAAACGRIDLVRWLVNIRNSNCDLKDEESGYTALHRSLFYGKINVAVEMIKLGANTSLFDSDSLTALEHVTKDGVLPWDQFGSLYTWGLNTNNSLGSFSSRITPECLDIFHKRFPKARVQQVCVDKFHSLIVTTEGEVYSCGHGLEGRLGLGTEQTIVVPTRIEIPSTEKILISKASISRDHCLLLSSDHTLYSCGSNKHKVLGLSPPPDKVLIPQKVKQSFSKGIEGISAARYHSVAWSVTMLFTWGLNGGQLGHETTYGSYVIYPKQVKVINTEGSSIKQVASSDGAIAVTTEKGDIYILHEYQCRKIASRLLDVADIAIIGGNLNMTLDKDLKREHARELKVVVRTNVGNLLLWQESDPQLCRCIFSIPRTFIVRQATININEILFVTKFGEAYRAVIKPRKKKTALEKKNEFIKFLLKEECITLKLTKVPRIHRAISIVSDPRGEDFCVIQQNPYSRNLSQEDPTEPEMEKQLATLLEEANEEDNIHDVIIKIGNKVFPAHRYILAHKSYTLQGICQEEEVSLKDVNADFFEQMLTFIYTGWCDLLQVGDCPSQFKDYCAGYHNEESETVVEDLRDKNKNKSIQNPIRMLQEVSKRFGCTQLYKILGSYDMQGLTIQKKDSVTHKVKSNYQINNFPEYHDVILKCRDNREIRAHKCILAARLDYFNSMFSVRWSCVEKSIISVPYPSNLVEALLEFVYTDSPAYLSKKDCDFLLKLLVIADEYLLNQLKNHCSFLLLTLTYLDLKNAVEILQFAHYYKADSLKEGTMKYIVNNMGYFLETQALNDLSDDILCDLTKAYFDQRQQICCRVITPYSTAVSDEVIVHVHKQYPVNIDVPEDKKAEKLSSKYPKRRTRTSKNSALESGVNKCFDNRSENLDSLIQFPDVLDTPESLPQKDISSITRKRLSAISSAMETLESEDCVTNYTNLNDSFTSLDQFPLLNSPPERSSHELSSPPSSGRSWNRHEGRHGMTRLSQRERKKLSSESKEVVQVTSESPKNPWKIISHDEASSPITSPSSGAAFSDILSNERKQKENLFKITNKLLIHTQLEDKAIVELEKFYSVDSIEDEIINIQRIEIGGIASPVWVPRNQGHNSHS